MKHLIPISALALVTACASTPDYSSPEASGLIGVRPYPGPNDVCQVIGENELTNQYLDHTDKYREENGSRCYPYTLGDKDQGDQTQYDNVTCSDVRKKTDHQGDRFNEYPHEFDRG